MILAGLAAIFSSIDSILYKKICIISEKSKYSDIIVTWLLFFLLILLYIIVNFFLPTSLQINFSLVNFSLLISFVFIVTIILDSVQELLLQYAYMYEKVSVLAPYSEMGSVFSVLSGLIAFVFFDIGVPISTKTLIVALFTGLVVALGSVDFKKFSFNKYCLVVMLSCITDSIMQIGVVYLLLHFSPITYLFINDLGVFLILCFVIFIKKIQIPIGESGFKSMIKLTFIHNIVWIAQKIIILTIISKEGLVVAVLLSMLTYVSTIIIAYFFLNDKPTKKDIIIGVFIIISAAIGLEGTGD